MKKAMVSITVLFMLIFLVGCLDYKAYDIPKEEDSKENTDLIDEIAKIEKELAMEESEDSEEIEEIQEEEEPEVLVEEVEIELPELTEETMEMEESTEETMEMEESTDDGMMVKVIKENELVKFNVNVKDPDEDPVTFTFSKPLDESGEWQTNYGDAGEYIVTLTATDGVLNTEKKIRLVVERVNVAPIISLLNDISVNEGEVVKFEPKVTDPNNDPVNIEISAPLNEGEFTTDHTSAGEYKIKVVASDGELESESSFMLIINDVNEKPIITGIEDITVKEGETIEINPKVSDLDEDEITLTISDPIGDDGTWETSFTDHGEYVVTVAAYDGKDKVIKQINITVEDVNMPPEIVEITLTN